MKRVIRLTENDLRGIIKSSVNRLLRETEDFKDFDYVPSANDYEGIVNNGLDSYDRFYNYDNKDEYFPEFDDFDLDDSNYRREDIDPDDLSDLDLPESRRMHGRMLTEKHRPSGVSRRIHTRDANGKKQSFDYIPNLPKYNKYQNFNQASKFQRINARPVEDPNGEDIDTVLKDGTIERKGLHLPQGYYNVNNVGGTEHWGIDPKTFNKKYEADPEQQGVYKPKGGPMLASNPLKRNTSFQAPWGGRMDMKAGSRILQDPNNPNDTYGIGGNEFDSTYKFDESRRRMSKIIKESIRKVMREASVYPDYDSTTTADIAGNGGGNIITCYGSPGIINGKYQSSGVGSILGLDAIYLSCNPPSREMTRMYGQLVPVKVDVSNFYRAKNAWEAKKLVELVGFKDEYSGILYHGNRDGDVCAVFDRSCIIG
jgi:hypothetical protein